MKKIYESTTRVCLVFMIVVKELSFFCNWVLLKEHLSQKTQIVSTQVKQQNNIRYTPTQNKTQAFQEQKSIYSSSPELCTTQLNLIYCQKQTTNQFPKEQTIHLLSGLF